MRRRLSSDRLLRTTGLKDLVASPPEGAPRGDGVAARAGWCLLARADELPAGAWELGRRPAARAAPRVRRAG